MAAPLPPLPLDEDLADWASFMTALSDDGDDDDDAAEARRRVERRAECDPQAEGSRAAESTRHCSERARVFGEWVLAKFGPRLQRDGLTVVDVAGGKGELSLLLTLEGLECVVVDPRPDCKLSRRQRKQLRKSGTTDFAVVEHEFGYHEAGAAAATQKVMERAGVVIGLHPDEATDAIVDTAIAGRVPFAVVPCCVFSRLFPHRRLRGGAPVTTHTALCEYVASRHPAAKVEVLPMGGKNIVVYVDSYDDDGGACLECEPPPTEQLDVRRDGRAWRLDLPG